MGERIKARGYFRRIEHAAIAALTPTLSRF